MLFFTHEIWKAFRERLQERAEYLWNLFLEDVQDFRPTSYLDVGAGSGYGTLVFGQKANEILAIDVRFSKGNVLRDSEKTHLMAADARFLPLRKELFDAVSLFSTIEHITNQKLVLREALRVLRSKGESIIQIPNRLFPVDLHSGLPLLFFLPSRVRASILVKIGYRWLSRYDVPSVNKLKKMIWEIQSIRKITTKKVVYPSSIVWSKLRSFYELMQKVHILNLVPLGYLLVIE